MQEKRKIVFLDIDGVLNSKLYDNERTEKDGNIDLGRLPYLKRIIDETGAEIVLSTTWREHWSVEPAERDAVGEELDATFAAHGLTITDKTPMLDKRADEIKAWLALHPEVKDFVIVDDIPYGWEDLEKHLVRTNYRIGRGLEEHHVEKAIAILNRA